MPRAIVVYATRYGCTRQVAEDLAKELSRAGAVRALAVRIGQVPVEQILEHDIVVVGSPNHFGGPMWKVQRLIGALGRRSGGRHLWAFFDTCLAPDRGNAVRKMEAVAREADPAARVVSPGLSVVVLGMKGPLSPEELPLCVDFARAIVSESSASGHAASPAASSSADAGLPLRPSENAPLPIPR